MSGSDLSYNDFRLLRTVTVTGDTTDWAASQTVPTCVELWRPGSTRQDAPTRIKVEIVVEFVDDEGGNGDPITTGRGSYDVQAIRVLPRRDIGGQVVCDSALLRGQIGFRPVLIDDLMSGDSFTVGVTNVSPPPGAISARVLYREIF